MNFLFTSMVGCGSGILASMGFGGGFILVIYLALFTQMLQKGAQGMNLLFFIPITVLAVIIHSKNKLIDFKNALICSGFGILAAILGFYLAQYLSNEWLRKLFALFIIVAGIKDIFQKSRECGSSDK